MAKRRANSVSSAGVREIAALALGLAAGAGVFAAAGAAAQATGEWSLQVLTSDSAGTQGARWPAMSGDGRAIGFRHDGEIDSDTTVAHNRLGRPQIFRWNPERWIEQLTDSRNAPSTDTQQTEPSIDQLGERLAFLSEVDLTGGNADLSLEVFSWDAVASLAQISTAASGDAGSPSISRDGRRIAFWHHADLVGSNPQGADQLFLWTIGQPIRQLTAFDATIEHGPAMLAANGNSIAFNATADLVGRNADGGPEIYLWRGPYTRPGDPIAFTQVTDHHAPMTGRTLLAHSVSGDGTRVAFAASGHAVESLPATLSAEIYLWRAGQPTQRITTGTSSSAASHLPRISDDGHAIAFISQSDLVPQDADNPGNADGSTELFVWYDAPTPHFSQVTASTLRRNIISADPELAPGIDRTGDAAAFIAERADDVFPLALSSRRGLLVRASLGDAYPPPVTETPEPTDPLPTQVPTIAPPTATPSAIPTAPWTATPSASPTPTPMPTATQRPGPQPRGVCPQMVSRIPAAVQATALANPEQFDGWLKRANPNRPAGPTNPLRLWLTIRTANQPYGPYNGAVWKAGCP
ncbi:MAG: hypothetical protein ABI780_13480 [Ardenticatenales bacterium]